MLVEPDDFASHRWSLPNGVLASPLRRFWGDARLTPPWDDSAPIRAELFSVERLEEHARTLAAAQTVSPGELKGASLAKRLKAGINAQLGKVLIEDSPSGTLRSNVPIEH